MGRSQSLLILLFLFLFDIGYAQDSLKTGRNFIPIPEFSFNTDFGVKVAAEALIYDYGYDATDPFENYTRYRVSYSTIGAFSLLASNDDVNAFDSNNRIFYYAFASRNLSDYFFGDTDNLDYDEARYDTSEYYDFEMIRAEVGGLMRTPINSSKKDGVEFKKGALFIFEKPVNQSENKFISSANIDGNEGAFLSLLEIGVILDKRDSEFRPVRGYFFDMGTKYAPPLISTHHGMHNYFTAYGFAPVLNSFINISLATRISFLNTVGDKPYWMTPSIGGTGTLRGFIFRRFSSDNALSYSAELRGWLFKIPNSSVEIGGQIFMDGGRVFSNNNWDSMLTEHKFSLGLGGVMSIFTPDFIMKAEVGFSEDGSGIYLGTGYSF